jgi:hypothetical protein
MRASDRKGLFAILNSAPNSLDKHPTRALNAPIVEIVILQFRQAVFCCLRAARKIHKSSASFAYCVRVTLRGLRCRALRIFDTRLTRVCVFRHRAPTKTWPTVFKQWLNVLWRKPQMPRFVTKATASNFHAGPNAKGRLTRVSLLCRSSAIACDVGNWVASPLFVDKFDLSEFELVCGRLPVADQCSRGAGFTKVRAEPVLTATERGVAESDELRRNHQHRRQRRVRWRKPAVERAVT